MSEPPEDIDKQPNRAPGRPVTKWSTHEGYRWALLLDGRFVYYQVRQSGKVVAQAQSDGAVRVTTFIGDTVEEAVTWCLENDPSKTSHRTAASSAWLHPHDVGLYL